MISFFTKTTSKLSKSNINDILRIKESHWSYGMRSQRKFFIENIKPNDLHNLLYYGKALIGYTSLRNSTYKDINNKTFKYLHFDTIIIKKKFRKRRFSYLMMLMNNFTIKEKSKTSILFCKKNMRSFYMNFEWKVLRKNIKLKHKSFPNKLTMVYNFK